MATAYTTVETEEVVTSIIVDLRRTVTSIIANSGKADSPLIIY